MVYISSPFIFFVLDESRDKENYSTWKSGDRNTCWNDCIYWWMRTGWFNQQEILVLGLFFLPTALKEKECEKE